MLRKLLQTRFINKIPKILQVKCSNTNSYNVRVLTTSPVRWKTEFEEASDEKPREVPATISSRFEPFNEETAPIILDVEEERRKIIEPVTEVIYDKFKGINLERGKTGVFDIEDVVELLRQEKAIDIFVAKIPPEFKYADYMVIVTGKSAKHMSAMAEFIRKVYKMKMNSNDSIPILEGKNSATWKALDLNNIIVHIFSRSVRQTYDLETLWSVGKEYDTLSKQVGGSNSNDYTTILANLIPNNPNSIP